VIRRILLLAACALLLLAAPPRAHAMPIERVVSPGGIVAWLVQDRTLPLVALQFRFRGGTAGEGAGAQGAARLAVDMLDEGAGELDATAFARALQEHSISLSIGASADSIQGSLRVLDAHRARGAELLRLALVAPRFDADALERVRTRTLAGLQRQQEDPRSILREAFGRLAWGAHPYGEGAEAEIASVRGATVEAMRGFLARRMARDNLVVGVVGNIDAAALGALLDQVFGGLPARAAPYDVPEARPAIDAERVVVLRRASPQALVMSGAPGMKRDDPDWFAAQLVNYVLGGGGFNSRLMTEMREKRGLTYGVSTSHHALDRGALVFASFSTDNARAGEAVELLRAQWRRMGEEGPGEQELEDAKAFLTGAFALSLDSSAAVAGLLVTLQHEGLGMDYLSRRDALIRGVTIEDARRVARRMHGAPGFLTVVVGEPAGVRGEGG
jgi:zinc protease